MGTYKGKYTYTQMFLLNDGGDTAMLDESYGDLFHTPKSLPGCFLMKFYNG